MKRAPEEMMKIIFSMNFTWGSFNIYGYYLFTRFESRTEVYFNQHYCIFPPKVSSDQVYNFSSWSRSQTIDEFKFPENDLNWKLHHALPSTEICFDGYYNRYRFQRNGFPSPWRIPSGEMQWNTSKTILLSGTWVRTHFLSMFHHFEYSHWNNPDKIPFMKWA